MPSTNQNQGGLATPPTTPPSKAQVLANVFALATQFSACVEVFNLIHPSKEWDHAQKVALAKLGIQQGRLLIFGDAVGISSPPANIAKHMIPSKPGATNPDPTLPINFGVRDSRLDEPETYDKVRAALNAIAGRPAHLSREELMEKYGLKSPKRFSAMEYPPLDTNRLEAFREKYGLLQDLVRESGGRPPGKRGMSMTIQHWTVQNVKRFCQFVKTVRVEVDGLIALMGVKEQVDRCMKTDIRSMGWHPDLNRQLIRNDWHKLQLIREACQVDYPEYIEVTDTALKYITEEVKGTGVALRAASVPNITVQPVAADEKSTDGDNSEARKHIDKRPGLLSQFFRGWTKSSSKVPQTTSNKNLSPSPSDQDTHRSISEDLTNMPSRQDAEDSLKPARSKSMSAVPHEATPFDLDTKVEGGTQESSNRDVDEIPIGAQAIDMNSLTQADTARSLA
jgi:hypothetical protein